MSPCVAITSNELVRGSGKTRSRSASSNMPTATASATADNARAGAAGGRSPSPGARLATAGRAEPVISEFSNAARSSEFA